MGGQEGVWLAWETHQATAVRFAKVGPDGVPKNTGSVANGAAPAVAAGGGVQALTWRDEEV